MAGGEGRVAADQKTLVGVQRGADLGEVSVVEQRHLNALLVGDYADGAVAQGRDPAEAGALRQVLYLGDPDAIYSVDFQLQHPGGRPSPLPLPAIERTNMAP